MWKRIKKIGIITILGFLGFTIFRPISLQEIIESFFSSIENIISDDSTTEYDKSFLSQTISEEESTSFYTDYREETEEKTIQSEFVESEENTIVDTADSYKETVDVSAVPFVTSTPKSDVVIQANLTDWNSSDRDIFNNNYSNSTAFKLSVYNTILSMGSGSDDITAEVHIPYGEHFDSILQIDFVTMQDMVGNGSYADVTISADGNILYPTFKITSETTDELSYQVDLNGVRDLVIQFSCHVIGNGFQEGIIFSDVK